MESSGKQKFIAEYIAKKMEGHGLSYGMTYLNLLADVELKAEKAWEKHLKKLKYD